MLNRLELAKAEIVLAEWMRKPIKLSIQELLALAARPGVVSFALGLPSPELFPTSLYAQAVDRVLSTDERALQYGVPFQPLRAHIVELMRLRGVECSEEQVFLTMGAQQAMTLIVRMLLDYGGSLICENSIYSGFQQVIEPLRPFISTVPTDMQNGIDVDAVELLLASGHRFAFVYTIPDGHNPTGSTMSAAKRERLVGLARRYAVPIIEDDAYGFLHYDDPPIPPMCSFDDDWVFYIGSFSKILAPALRVGWIIAPRRVCSNLTIVRESIDIDTCTLTQRTVAAFIELADMPGHIARLRSEYRARRDAMVEALRDHLPAEVRWEGPRSGFFVWVGLPHHLLARDVLTRVMDTQKVAFIPGECFSVNPDADAEHYMRLSFSHCTPAIIKEGVKRMGQSLSKEVISRIRPESAASRSVQ